MRVNVGDVELHVREQGAGRPLVLLHGGPGLDGAVFFPEIGALADEGVRLLAIDHRGNGRSGDGDPARWTVPQMADDVEAVIGALGLERPVVMGHSFGSFVAQQHMAAHATAAGYVLMGTVDSVEELLRIEERLAAFEPEHLRDQVARSWAEEATVASAEGAAQLMRDQLPFHLADPEGPRVGALQEALGEIVHRPDVLRHFASGGEYGLVDNRARLRELDIPVLVLSGEHDRTTPAAAAHRLAEMLRDADEVVVPGAAHMLLQEQPAATLAALRAFLARVPASNRRMPVRRIVPDFPASDVAASRELYVDVLGLDVVMDLGWVVTYAAPGNGAVQLSVMAVEAGGGVQPDVSIEVDDVDAVHAAAVARGYEIVRPLRDEEWGVRRFFLRDASGKVLNIVSHSADGAG